MPFADLREQRFYFEDSGGSGPAVVLSHGFFMDHEMFAPQVEALAGGFRVITWDERGWGQTSWTAPFTYYDLTEDCMALLDHLGVEKAVLGGMSQGGFLSLRAALGHPERVRGLVLIDTYSEGFEEQALGFFGGIRDELLANGFNDANASMLAGLFFAPGFDARYWIAKWRARPTSLLIDSFDCLMKLDDISDRLSEIACPALVIHGEFDASFPVATAQRMCERLPGCSELLIVPGAGHTSNLMDPEMVNARVREFLRLSA